MESCVPVSMPCVTSGRWDRSPDKRPSSRVSMSASILSAISDSLVLASASDCLGVSSVLMISSLGIETRAGCKYSPHPSLRHHMFSFCRDTRPLILRPRPFWRALPGNNPNWSGARSLPAIGWDENFGHEGFNRRRRGVRWRARLDSPHVAGVQRVGHLEEELHEIGRHSHLL